MAVYFVSMESTAGFGLLAGDRIIAPDAATAKAIGEAAFLDDTMPADMSPADAQWFAKLRKSITPRINAGYVIKARKVRL